MQDPLITLLYTCVLRLVYQTSDIFTVLQPLERDPGSPPVTQPSDQLCPHRINLKSKDGSFLIDEGTREWAGRA